MGEKIKFRRQQLGISQERLAEILDVSYQQVQRYENGTNRLNVENIQLIAQALDVPITFFFRTDYEENIAEPSIPYAPLPEERTLLKYFKKIENNTDRLLVINVARLAAKKQP